MKHLLTEGEISLLLPEGNGGGRSKEVHLIRHQGKKYVVRRCAQVSKAKLYEKISKTFEKYHFLPKFLARHGKDVFYEYIEGRDLVDKESSYVYEQLGKIAAHINKVSSRKPLATRFNKQVDELSTGNYRFSVKENNTRASIMVKKKLKKVFSKRKAVEILQVFDYLKNKAKPTTTLDANDFSPENFRLAKDKRIYLVDVEAIKPRVKGFGIAKFYLQWGKTESIRKSFNKGYASVASLQFLTNEYLDFLYLNFLIQKINYSIKLYRKNDYEPSIKLLNNLLDRYL